MLILGISAYYHDAAAAILRDGKVVAAAQEERFSRVKHDARFPAAACRYCLRTAGVRIDELDAVVFYEKPFLTFERLLETYYRFAPRGLRSFLRAMPVWLKEKLFLKRTLRKALAEIEDYDPARLTLLFSEHHLSHAASAFFASPYAEAAILTVDGVGEWATASIAVGKGNGIRVLKELHFPHSLGLLYAAFTYYLGFKVNGGEYKMMGLAPYGDAASAAVAKYRKIIREELIDLQEDGSIWLNQRYFTYATGLRMVPDRRWEDLFGFPRRPADEPIAPHHCNLALAIQGVTETVLLRMSREARRITGANKFCLAGGVALNCVANGKLLTSGEFADVFIPPAAGDAGGAPGAAFAAYHVYFGKPRFIPTTAPAAAPVYLGPDFGKKYIRAYLNSLNHPYRYYADFTELCQRLSRLIAAGKVVGWFQGRMEFGPRALGNRSILADPRDERMQMVLNRKIKNREDFRPFAPAVLAEEAATYFELDRPSPYMLLVSGIKETRRKTPVDSPVFSLSERMAAVRSGIPAVTHVDYSARIQTVTEADNSRFWQLLRAFRRETGCGVLINTSFNVRDEPIVCTPQEAYRCFRNTEMDVLVLGNFVIEK